MLDRPAPVHVDGAVADHPDVGGRAPHVEHDQMAQAVVARQGAGALQPAARAGAVGLERRGLRHAGRGTVVAEDPQRLAGTGVPQPPVGVEQESLYGRMQERVEQARPGAADIVGVGDEFPGKQQRDRAEQVTGIEPQQQSFHPGLAVRAARAAHRDHQAPGPARGQVVDPREQLAAQRLVVGVQADRAPPAADQGRQQVLLGMGGGQALDQRRIGDQQAQLRSGPLHQSVGALGGGIPDAVRGLQQRRELRFPVGQLGDLGQAVEQAPAQVIRRGQGLGVAHLVAIDEAEVGQRAAVVDVYQPCHACASPPACPAYLVVTAA